jgi:hypothetical protein
MATATPELNRNFASAVGADGLPVYAPAYIMVGGRLKLHPTAADYAAHTPPCYPVEDKRPENPAPAGYHYEAQGYVLDAEASRIRRVYALVADPPPPPRRWSRLSIKTALAQAEMLAAARAHLASVEIATGYTAWEALTDCDYIEEGYPDATKWDALLDGAASALGKTRAEIDAFLSQIPREGAQ